MTSPRRLIPLLLISLAFMFALSACRAQTATPTLPVSDPTVAQTLSVDTPASVTQAQPQASPTVNRAPVILLTPPGADAVLKQGASKALQALATQNGLSFETVETLTPGELSGVRLVVVLPPDPGITALSQASTATLFITVGLPLPSRLERVSRILPADNAAEQAAFVAGYTAALVAADWRAGVLANGDSPEGQRVQQAFINGAQFFCGLCKPAYPPFFTYPRAYSLAAPDDAAGLQAALASMDEHDIDVLYVDTSLATPAVLDALAAQGIHLIATVEPSDGARANWVASLQTDPLAVLPSMAAQALAGSLPAEVTAGLRFTHRESGLLSDARLRLAEPVAGDVAAGRISPIPAE